MIALIASLVGIGILIGLTFWIISLRRVVNTNEVHIVQTKDKSVSYGKGEEAGNVYYEFPSWMPIIGIQTIRFPVSVFSQRLDAYEAYDKGRLPFVLDMEAFFRISDSTMAAQRVLSFEELKNQLRSILQGAARTILASKDIEEIMQGRAEFGVAFTKEVDEQLKSWGVTTVKNIELMDIRDGKDSKVIANIMEKKKSFIEMQSRVEVAENTKLAMNAEIDAKREIELNKQTAEQQVGIRTAEKEKEVGIARELSIQQVKEQEKVTTEKSMEVVKVQEVKKAEIQKEVVVVQAKQDKEMSIIVAEGQKESTVLDAEAKLEAKRKESEGIKLEGEAKALAEEKMQLAPVNAQITLAKEIGENVGYQQYLVTIRQVEAQQAIGIENAKALKESDLKVIVNSGDVASGVTSLSDVLSSKGGQGLGAALEGLANTDAGKQLLNKFIGK